MAINGLGQTVADILIKSAINAVEIDLPNFTTTQTAEAIDDIVNTCQQNGIKLKGIKVASDLMSLPTRAEFMNAFFGHSTLIVIDTESASRLVVRRK